MLLGDSAWGSLKDDRILEISQQANWPAAGLGAARRRGAMEGGNERSSRAKERTNFGAVVFCFWLEVLPGNARKGPRRSGDDRFFFLVFWESQGACRKSGPLWEFFFFLAFFFWGVEKGKKD